MLNLVPGTRGTKNTKRTKETFGQSPVKNNTGFVSFVIFVIRRVTAAAGCVQELRTRLTIATGALWSYERAIVKENVVMRSVSAESAESADDSQRNAGGPCA